MSQPNDSREVLNWAGAVLAVASMCTLVFVIFMLATQEIPKSNENLFYAIVTGLIGLVTMVFSFFFGSSHQTKKQSETIDRLSTAAKAHGPNITAQPGDTIRSESSTQTETRID
jgi:hypothetical protein